MEVIDIYTDGSAEKKGTRLGCGSFCLFHDNEYRMSVDCTRELLTLYGIKTTQPCSNPTAEFVAFVETLKILRNTKEKYHLKFWIDYNGIGKWISGEWKAKEPHIRAVLKEYQSIRKGMLCEVSVHWVRGHSGTYENDQADKMAGLYKTNVEEFVELANLISSK